MNRAVDYAFSEEAAARTFGGSEMDGRETPGEHAIHLFGKRLGHVACAQAGFDVADGNARVESG